jgi:hypothetical protein
MMPVLDALLRCIRHFYQCGVLPAHMTARMAPYIHVVSKSAKQCMQNTHFTKILPPTHVACLTMRVLHCSPEAGMLYLLSDNSH